MKLNQIPQELKERKQWFLWREEDRGGKKPDKVPYQISGKHALTNDQKTWSTFDEVAAIYQQSDKYSGLGFVFTEDDPYTGVDIDECVTDGEMNEVAAEWTERFDAYTEMSHSGSGIHILIKGKLPVPGKHKGSFEAYSSGRYFALTGDIWPGLPVSIPERQDVLEQFYEENLAPKTLKKPVDMPVVSMTMSDEALIQKALRAKNGDKFRRLFEESDVEGYSSHSEADMALCNLIAFYTKDPEQIKRVMQNSQLVRDKWKRDDYLDRTIKNALGTPLPQQEIQTVADYPAETSAEYLSSPDGFFGQMDQIRRDEPLLSEIKTLDKVLGGGFYPGLYVIGAISSLGKTALCGQIADAFAKNSGRPVLFVSLEMSRYEMVSRSVMRELFLTDTKKYMDNNTGQLMNGQLPRRDVERTAQAYADVTGRNMVIQEGNFCMGMVEIRKECERIRDTWGVAPIVFIDYLQILPPIKDGLSDKQTVDYNISEAKRISRDLDTPVILVSSLNRASYSQAVTMSAFKESGSVEYGVDVLLGLQLTGIGEQSKDSNAEEQKHQFPRKVELVVLKNRRGSTGNTIPFHYYTRQNFFDETR